MTQNIVQQEVDTETALDQAQKIRPNVPYNENNNTTHTEMDAHATLTQQRQWSRKGKEMSHS